MKKSNHKLTIAGILIGPIATLLAFGIYDRLNVSPKVMLFISALMLALSWVALAIYSVNSIREIIKLKKELKDSKRRKEAMKRSVNQKTPKI